MATVPGDAEAIDLPCPHCGERPIEQAAKAVRVTGFLLAYSLKRKTVIGCAACTRGELLKAAAGTMLTGWWSITSAIMNPFVILWNLLRAPYNRGPTSGLVETIEAEGIEVSFLEDREAFEPTTGVSTDVLLDDFDAAASGGGGGGAARSDLEDQVLLEGVIQLAGAVMLADGQPSTEQAQQLRDVLQEVFPDRDSDELESLIKEHLQAGPDVAAVTDELSGVLTEDGEDLVLEVAMDVALADGPASDAEIATLTEITDGLGMGMDEEAVELLLDVRGGTDLDDAVDEHLGEVDD
jgi:uncharacterized tellurite resistance protein B-like protein